MDLLKLNERVRLILISDPESRDDDKLLYYLVCSQIAEERGFNIENMTVKEFLTNPDLKLPGSKSVERCRRKLQENPAYWGKKKEVRMQYAGEFKEFAHNNMDLFPGILPEEPEEEDNPFLDD
jgi:hypothetical protein